MLDRRITGLNAERISYDAIIAERRKRVPLSLHALETNLEDRRTAAEWLEEGEDEDEHASTSLA